MRNFVPTLADAWNMRFMVCVTPGDEALPSAEMATDIELAMHSSTRNAIQPSCNTPRALHISISHTIGESVSLPKIIQEIPGVTSTSQTTFPSSFFGSSGLGRIFTSVTLKRCATEVAKLFPRCRKSISQFNGICLTSGGALPFIPLTISRSSGRFIKACAERLDCNGVMSAIVVWVASGEF